MVINYPLPPSPPGIVAAKRVKQPELKLPGLQIILPKQNREKDEALRIIREYSPETTLHESSFENGIYTLLNHSKSSDEQKIKILEYLSKNPVQNRSISESCWKIFNDSDTDSKLKETSAITSTVLFVFRSDARNTELTLPLINDATLSEDAKVQIAKVINEGSVAIPITFQKKVALLCTDMLSNKNISSSLRSELIKLARLASPEDRIIEILKATFTSGGPNAKGINERINALTSLVNVAESSPDDKDYLFDLLARSNELLKDKDTPYKLKVGICRIIQPLLEPDGKLYSRSLFSFVNQTLLLLFQDLSLNVINIDTTNIQSSRDTVEMFRILNKVDYLRRYPEFNDSLKSIAVRAKHRQIRLEAKKTLAL